MSRVKIMVYDPRKDEDVCAGEIDTETLIFWKHVGEYHLLEKPPAICTSLDAVYQLAWDWGCVEVRCYDDFGTVYSIPFNILMDGIEGSDKVIRDLRNGPDDVQLCVLLKDWKRSNRAQAIMFDEETLGIEKENYTHGISPEQTKGDSEKETGEEGTTA